ncbi:MAG: sugar nucleotide-binding protein [Candidatus Fermentibacteraceae bacterium]|nr:sugar nucleotide-binding protein [Candidatus Fermentibacteraceae bacterium]MBN2608160.1 sugar nucleotide-binding protein [Candidatus Fermentibacteraceae bacterium]
MNRLLVLLTGAGGRLGSVILDELSDTWDIIPVFGSGEGPLQGFDLLSSTRRRELLGLRFDLAVNAAAISSPAECRERPAVCLLVNTLWPRLLAGVCRGRSVPFVHFSSDLVYSGANPPYDETSHAVPLSFYGWSKLAADEMVMRANPDALVVRTSVLCGETRSKRTTFSHDVLCGRIRNVWVDSWRNHTPVRWLARLLPELLERGRSGLVIASGKCARTRAAYAEALLRAHGMPTDHLILEYSPPGIPSSLDLRGTHSTGDDIV